MQQFCMSTYVTSVPVTVHELQMTTALSQHCAKITDERLAFYAQFPVVLYESACWLWNHCYLHLPPSVKPKLNNFRLCLKTDRHDTCISLFTLLSCSQKARKPIFQNAITVHFKHSDKTGAKLHWIISCMGPTTFLKHDNGQAAWSTSDMIIWQDHNKILGETYKHFWYEKGQA